MNPAEETPVQTTQIEKPPRKRRISILILCFLLAIITGSFFYIRVLPTIDTKKENLENLSAYERIQQEQEARIRSFRVSVAPIEKRQARGKHTLHLVFLRPPTLSESAIMPLIAKLQDPRSSIFSDCAGCENNASFNYIKSLS